MGRKSLNLFTSSIKLEQLGRLFHSLETAILRHLIEVNPTFVEIELDKAIPTIKLVAAYATHLRTPAYRAFDTHS